MSAVSPNDIKLALEKVKEGIMYHHTDYSIINKLLEKFYTDVPHDDFEVYVFPQMWGSTALGYSGFGGQAMTTASTIVLYAFHENIVRVYFGCEKLAYQIKNPNNLFWEDLKLHRIAEQFKAGKYKREE